MRLHFIKVLIILFTIFCNDVCNASTQDVSKDLATLSKQFTGRFLKSGYSHSDVYDALIYLKNKTELALYTYTFKNNTWTMNILTPERDSSTHAAWSRLLLAWLNQNITKNIKEGFTFAHLPQEPIHECGWMNHDMQIKLKNLFEKCPILATCTHPKILWTENAVLIPDPFILNDGYSVNVKKITSSKLLPFKGRQANVFFRGAVSGHRSSSYNMESLSKDDRLILFVMSKAKSFIDSGITSDGWIDDKDRVTPDFKEWYLTNLADKRSPYADFIEHARHKYLISIDGFGAAWSRIQYILFTGSVLLLRAECKQYFYPLLTHMKTHININSGLTNLEETYTYLEQNPKVAESIANNGKAFADKYLTKNAIGTYLSHIIYDLNEAYQEPSGWKVNVILNFKKTIYICVDFKYKSKLYFKNSIKPFFMKLKLKDMNP